MENMLRLLSLPVFALMSSCSTMEQPPKVEPSTADPRLTPSANVQDVSKYPWEGVPPGFATSFKGYESDLQAMFGEIVSVEIGDGTLSVKIHRSEHYPEIWISGVPTQYMFASARVVFLQWNGAFLCAAVILNEEVDQDLESKVKTMFRSHESTSSIEFRLSDDRRRMFVVVAELRKECEEAQGEYDEEAEPGATDNPDDAQRI